MSQARSWRRVVVLRAAVHVVSSSRPGNDCPTLRILRYQLYGTLIQTSTSRRCIIRALPRSRSFSLCLIQYPAMLLTLTPIRSFSSLCMWRTLSGNAEFLHFIQRWRQLRNGDQIAAASTAYCNLLPRFASKLDWSLWAAGTSRFRVFSSRCGSHESQLSSTAPDGREKARDAP